MHCAHPLPDVLHNRNITIIISIIVTVLLSLSHICDLFVCCAWIEVVLILLSSVFQT